MHLNISNIGMINSAQIDINGITLIAGTNNTGKSTVGKVLFAVYHSIDDCTKNASIYKKKSIMNDGGNLDFSLGGFLDDLDNEYEKKQISEYQSMLFNSVIADNFVEERVIECLQDLTKAINEVKIASGKKVIVLKFLKRIKEILSLSDISLKRVAVERGLSTELNNQINNVFETDSLGKIEIMNHTELEIRAEIKANKIDENNFIFKNSLYKEITLIDNTILGKNFIFSKLNSFYNNNYHVEHTMDLFLKLFEKNDNLIDAALNEHVTKEIDDLFNDVIEGDFVLSASPYYEINGKKIDWNNVSSGLRSFSLPKILLNNGHINSNSIIIFDEPESGLHPDWQLALAEIIVQMSAKLNAKFILTSHSPYFISAIERYSKKYNFEEQTKLYLAESEGEFSAKITDVTKETHKIYAALAKAYEKLDELENQYE